MSVNFFIKNKKRLLGYEAVLTVQDSLSLILDLDQFNAKSFENEKERRTFLKSKISEIGSLLFGVYGESGRGFEFSYDEDSKSYGVRVLTPSTRNDWTLALEFMSVLAKKMNSNILSEEGENYNSESIFTFPYENDILFGINCILERGVSNDERSLSEGICRPVSFSKEMCQKILESEDRILAYEEMIYQLQYMDAYSARQFFYSDKKEGKTFGVYTLTQNLRTILPYEPYVEISNWGIVERDQISYWQITLVGVLNEGEEDEKYEVIGSLVYEEFIKKLAKDKYEFIDGTYIVVEPLSYEEMLSLVEGELVS